MRTMMKQVHAQMACQNGDGYQGCSAGTCLAGLSLLLSSDLRFLLSWPLEVPIVSALKGGCQPFLEAYVVLAGFGI